MRFRSWLISNTIAIIWFEINLTPGCVLFGFFLLLLLHRMYIFLILRPLCLRSLAMILRWVNWIRHHSAEMPTAFYVARKLNRQSKSITFEMSVNYLIELQFANLLRFVFSKVVFFFCEQNLVFWSMMYWRRFGKKAANAKHTMAKRERMRKIGLSLYHREISEMIN